MASSRFYLSSVDGTNPVSPAYSAAWNQTGEAVRRKLEFKRTISFTTPLTDKTVTVPITTSQNILNVQFVSDPIPAQRITGVHATVVRGLEDNLSTNAHPAFIGWICSQDGSVNRGTFISVTGASNEYSASAEARADGNGTGSRVMTDVVTAPGDRIVFEYGVRAVAPGVAGTCTQRFGFSATTDFALTNGLTTDLNPFMELSLDIFARRFNNYQFTRGASGMSVSERIFR